MKTLDKNIIKMEGEMFEAKEKEEFSKEMRIIWIIWLSMLGSLLFYVIISHLIVNKIKINPTSDFNNFKYILYIISIVTLIFAYFLRKIMLKVKPINSESQIPQYTSQIIKSPYISKYLQAMLISLALSDSTGVYGLFLFFLTRDFGSLYGFVSISAIGMFIYRPKVEELERLVIAMTQNITP